MQQYKEISPSVSLQPFVDHYWLRSVEESGALETFYRSVPCVEVEVVIHISEHFLSVLKDGVWVPLPQTYVTGISQNVTYLKATGPIRVIGIRFTAEGFVRLFNMPISFLNDNMVDLAALMACKFDKLVDQLGSAINDIEYIELIELFIDNQLHMSDNRDGYLLKAPNLIRDSAAEFALEFLSASLLIGSRQLQRTFKETYGVTPKTYQRIARFNKAYRFLQQAEQVDWTAIACNFGYADQAHFIRDFTSFAGITPTAARTRRQTGFNLE